MSRLLIAVAAVILAVSPAAADDKFVKIVHVPTGKVLAVADDSDDAAAKIVLAADEAKEVRQWKLEKDGDHYKIVNRKTGKVLDVNEDSRDEGGELIQYDAKDDGNDNQRFAWVGTGAERRLKAKSSGMVLTADGDKVVQKKVDDKSKGQLWKVVEVK